ncbi:insulinase family protein [Asticcacaulis sp. BYS171W]|uniref:Insulinase family protein n=1 Tax=Asticcacaulis aquaticus TaxID=2984212 RepID=A0ABT5HXN6_9CAUL|nr:M16 family metallopeptidase [Asticcacaulis aquaticus]MDC7684620.1 insulinase family protein [Asticcacaulis aquaticus]
MKYMTIVRQALACLVVGAGLFGPVVRAADAIAQVGAQAGAAQQKPTGAPQPWLRGPSDLPSHPEPRIGRLPNGLTYVIFQSPAPRNTAALRLIIHAGSMQERDDQRGLAHFVEHMAFNGSKNIPEGELTKILARHGFQFGSDANAFTTYDNTAYVLDLPNTDAETVDTAFFILRETATNLTFAPDAIDRERGVILGEERVRATPASRIAEEVGALAYKGQLYAERRPIGLTDIIKNAPPKALIDYYRTWYRPELATLIIVGDIRTAEIEAKIAATFGDWRGEGPSPAPVDPGAYVPKGTVAYVFADPNFPEALTLRWSRPALDKPDTFEARRIGIAKDVAVSVLNDRFARRAREADSPFLAAALVYANNRLTVNSTSLNVTPKPGKSHEALTEAVRLYHQFKAFGVTEEELNRMKVARDTLNVNTLAADRSRQHATLMTNIVYAVLQGRVYMSARQVNDLWTQVRPGLTVEAVNTQIAFLTGGDGPFIVRSGPTREAFEPAAITAAYAAAEALPVEPFVAVAAKDWPYPDFGVAGAVVKTEVVKAYGMTQYTYANGLKVNIRQTRYQSSRVLVSVRMAGGRMLFSPHEKVSLVPVMLYNLPGGGLGKLSSSEISKSLSGRTYSVKYTLGDDEATLNGTTTTIDFPLQMQVLMAYYSDPGYRPENFDNLKLSVATSLRLMKSNPNAMLSLGALSYLNADDPRMVFPTAESFAAVTNDHVKGLIERTLRDVPIEITIVGDISHEAALEAVGRTFGTLPSLPKTYRIARDADRMKLPTDRTPRVFTHQGRADQAVSFLAFPTTDLYRDFHDSRGLDLLARIYAARLKDEVREKQGATYGVTVSHNPSEVYKGYGYIGVTTTVRPEMDEAFYRTALSIAADLRDKPVTQDELDRARLPVLEGLEQSERTNGYWYTTLPNLLADTRRQDFIRDRPAQYKAVTVADIQRLARLYLLDKTVLRLKVVPETAGKPDGEGKSTQP